MSIIKREATRVQQLKGDFHWPVYVVDTKSRLLGVEWLGTYQNIGDALQGGWDWLDLLSGEQLSPDSRLSQFLDDAVMDFIVQNSRGPINRYIELMDEALS